MILLLFNLSLPLLPSPPFLSHLSSTSFLITYRSGPFLFFHPLSHSQEVIAIVILVSLLSTFMIYFISILGTSPQTFEDAVRQQRQSGFDLSNASKASIAAKKKEKERLRKERKKAEAGGGAEKVTPKADKMTSAEKKKKKKAAAAALTAAEAVGITTTDESHDEAGENRWNLSVVS